MGIDDIEIPDEGTLTQDMGEYFNNVMFGEGNPLQEKAPEQTQPEAEPQGQTSDEVEPQTEEPNREIRLDKLKGQRDEARDQLIKEREARARLEGELAALKQQKETEADTDTVDETEYMTDGERLAYNKARELESVVSKLTDVIETMQKDKNKESLQKQEDAFFELNPDLSKQKDEVVGNLVKYLEDKPELKKMITTKRLSLQELYGMYKASKPESTVKKEVSDPNKVFSGKTSSAPPAGDKDVKVLLDKAASILGNPDSENKADAVKVLQDSIVADITSQLTI